MGEVPRTRATEPTARSAFLRAAEEVFAARGAANAEVAEIAQRAGLSEELFYLHFDSKEAALERVIETWLARCSTFFAAPTEYPDGPVDPDSLLDFCIERDVQLYEFLWQSKSTLGILRSCRNDYDVMIQTFRDEMRRRNRAWLDQWRNDGLIRPEVEVELAATLMSGAFEELAVRMMKSEQRPSLERWLEFAQATFVRAFGTPELVNALDRRNRRADTGPHPLPERAPSDGIFGASGSPSSHVQVRNRG
jgi:AcrR family transcriptional regulator